ncbi:Solute carrier family 35 member G2 [Orchesella cincta]|uniref:Solute carrier family 35 member G2 n=1 Tax=Orchesella cincta TaxID=48709 RepID=A0A1D2NIC4_ORCCI|nr:Solute carrier family 35 member G2 [Orchesella cincta]
MSYQKLENIDERNQENDAPKRDSAGSGKKVSIISIVSVKNAGSEAVKTAPSYPLASQAALLYHDPTILEKKSWLQRFKGLLAILIATAILALNPQILYYEQELYGDEYSKSNFLMWMYGLYLVQNIIPCTFAAYFDSDSMHKPFKKNPKLWIAFVLRGMCGSVVLLLIFGAVRYFHRTAPIAIIMAMAPLFVYINAFFVLKEKIGWITVLNAVIALAGVVVMNLNEGFVLNENTWIGTLMAFLAMYLLSWVTVLVRILKDVHPLVVNLSFGIFGMTVQGLISFFTGTIKPFKDGVSLLLCLSIATCATFGNVGYNIALRNEQAGIVALVRTTEVIFSFVYQYLFFNIPPKAENIYGAILVMFGVVSVTLRKIVKESEEHSKLRKYFFFLLY